MLLITLFKAIVKNCINKNHIHPLCMPGVFARFNYSLYCVRLKIYTFQTLLRQSRTCQWPVSVFIPNPYRISGLMPMGTWTKPTTCCRLAMLPGSSRIILASGLITSMMVNGILCATGEFMVLHYATRESRPIVMPESVQAALKQVLVPITPDWAGRHISLRRS